MNHTMQRWEIPGFGLEELSLNTVPMPAPKAGEVLVQVEAVSLNYRDAEVVDNGMGTELKFPFTPASDMAGTVIAVGEGVSRFKEGDRVISAFVTGWIDGTPMSWQQAPTQGGPTPGMLAQYVATPADWCVLAPKTLTAAQASTLPVAALTAWMALIELGHLHAGQTVVVQGTGGVSLFAVQFAAAQGAQVIITSSSDEKIQQAIKLGATHGINRHTTPEWQTAVRELTDGRGADHVLEMAGGDNLRRSLEAVTTGGRVSVIGLLESEQLNAPLMTLLGSRASIVGIAVGPRRVLEDLIRMVDQHGIKPVVAGIYAFEDAPKAFAHLKRGAFGKVVIEVQGSDVNA